jgi:hypothetical protein
MTKYGAALDGHLLLFPAPSLTVTTSTEAGEDSSED